MTVITFSALCFAIGFFIGFFIGMWRGRNTIDHEMHTELVALREEKRHLQNVLVEHRRKADRAIDAIKVIELRLKKLEE